SERQSGDTIDLFTSGLSASYEVDLWGRIRSEAEAQRLRTEATRADYETAALTLSGEVALTWYRLLARTEILALIEDQIAANEKVAKSLIGRFRGGEARSVDVLRQEQLIEATRELKIVTDSEISVLENQLQFLLGNAPQKSLSHTKAALPELPPLPDAGLPAELLLRRPNLKASYLELLATNQDFASAVSERYPRIDLTASLRSASEDSSDLFNDWLSSIAGNIAAPIIDGGNRRAEVERQAALQRQRAAEFAQDSLVAFREVEDALVQEKQETLRYQSLNRQVELQKTAFEQLQKEFLNGVGNFIDVLAAQTSAQQLQRDLIESKRRQIEFRIALHRSIAGPIQAQEKRK
ncbi:MAG: TolC family protein, partial [Opitutales bacterium]